MCQLCCQPEPEDEEEMKDRTVSLRIGWWLLIAFFSGIAGAAFLDLLH